MNLAAAFRLLILPSLLLCGFNEAAQAQPTTAELARDPALFLETARKRSRWDEPAEPARLVGPIYFVGTRGLSVFLVTTPQGHIIVNTGMPGSGPMIESSIRKLGFKPEEIRILLCTHAHVDHAGGHAYLQKLSGARVVMMREEKDLLESGGKLDFHYGASQGFQFEPVKVDEVVDDGGEIRLGDIVITALLTGGHTRGSTSFALKIADGGRTWNVLIPDGLGINPGYRVSVNPSYPGIEENYRRTLRVLGEHKPDIWLRPHNEAYGFEAKLVRSATEGSKAWVDPAGYQAWLAEQQKNLDAAVVRERAAAGPAR